MASPAAKLGLAASPLSAAVVGRGRSPESETREILGLAATAGMRVLDGGLATAGTEALWGAALPRPAPFDVVIRAARGDRGGAYIEAEARASLGRLGLTAADCIMVQSAGDLFSPFGDELWSRLRGLRDAGLFRKIGISAYVSDDPAGLARRFQPDVIQAPVSLLDQRLLLDGSLDRLAGMGIEVHLRSIFLHGLLLRPPGRAPNEARAAVARLSRARRMIAEGRSDPLQAALGFTLSRPEASAVIVAASSAAEMSAMIAAAANPPPDLDWDDMALEDPEALDPRRWAAE